MGNSSSNSLQIKFREVSGTNIDFWTPNKKLMLTIHPDQRRAVRQRPLEVSATEFAQLPGPTFILPSTTFEDFDNLLQEILADHKIEAVEDVLVVLRQRGMRQRRDVWTVIKVLVNVCSAMAALGTTFIASHETYLAITNGQ